MSPRDPVPTSSAVVMLGAPPPWPHARPRERVAVIGSGIAGLTTAWLLRDAFDVTLYEAQDRLGGHTHTVKVDDDGRELAVDTGFIVFNERTYPNFCRLLDLLGVKSRPSDMSFGVRCERTGLEYSGTSLDTLYAQRGNLLRPRHHRMLLDIVRFSARCRELLAAPEPDLDLRTLIARGGYGSAFEEHYLAPMASAVWSTGTGPILEFPAFTFARFFEHHGFLDLKDRPVWRVIEGGSRRYVDRIAADLTGRVRLSTPVRRVERHAHGARVVPVRGAMESFDHEVIAAHADQALRMLDAPTNDERRALGSIAFTGNDVLLHTDESLLPRNHRARASWNAHVVPGRTGRATLTYDQTRLQSLDSSRRFLVTLNRPEAVRPDTVLRRLRYEHPLFDRSAVAAQSLHERINGPRRTYFCGAYWGYGFHEDGVRSALSVARRFGQVLA